MSAEGGRGSGKFKFTHDVTQKDFHNFRLEDQKKIVGYGKQCADLLCVEFSMISVNEAQDNKILG